MTTIKYILAISCSCFLSGGLMAQNLEESLTVEGKYTPEVIAADRLSVLPSIISLSAPESSLDYDQRGVVANFAPDALSMPATGWNAYKAFDTSRGYLDLSLGSWLNSSLSAGYSIIQNEESHLNVRLQHNSTSLWQAWKADPEKGMDSDAPKRFRYDETIGADFSHRFANSGILSADLQYHFGHFNYYASKYNYSSNNDNKPEVPTQTLNDIYFRIGWTKGNSSRINNDINADIRYFGYKNSYTQPDLLQIMKLTKGKGLNEVAINVEDNTRYDFSKDSKLCINLLYSGVLNSIDNNVNRIRLTPKYEYTRNNMTFHVGAEAAVVFAGKTRFRIAPDIKFTANSGSTAFTARIGGGTHLRTLSYLHQMDYYGNPLSGCYEAAYSPIDASLALQFNPGGKWTFGVEGLWRTTLDETLGGIYQAYLNWHETAYENLISTRIHGFSIGVNAGYEFSRYFGLKGKVNWQPQHGNTGFLNGFDRPAITANVTAASKPIDALSLTLDYNLRAKRELLNGSISRLNLSADYKINDNMSVGAEFNNLLNRHEYILPDLPTEGFTANARFGIIF